MNHDEAARQGRPATTDLGAIVAPRVVVVIGIEADPVAYLIASDSVGQARITLELCQPGCDRRILAAVERLRDALLDQLEDFEPGDIWRRAA